MSQQYYCSVVQIGDDHSTRFTSPLTLFQFAERTVNSACDLWNPGVYSNFDSTRELQGFTTLDIGQKLLNRRLTLQSDSGNESVDTSFSEDESVASSTKKVIKPVTIYDLKKHELKKGSDDVVLNIYVNPNQLCNEKRIAATHQTPRSGMHSDYKVVPWGLEQRPVGKIRNPYKCDTPDSCKSEINSGVSKVCYTGRKTSSESSEPHRTTSEVSDLPYDDHLYQKPIRFTDSVHEQKSDSGVQAAPEFQKATGIQVQTDSRSHGTSNQKPTSEFNANSPPKSDSGEKCEQNPRIPVWKSRFLDNKQKISGKMDADISAASFTFYDQNGLPQDSLSQRVSAHLLRKSAIRASIPRGRSQTFVDKSAKPKVLQPRYDRSTVIPRRQQISDQKRRSVSVHNENVITVHGKTKCSACQFQLGRGQAMVISDLNLFYHMGCFVCQRCKVPLTDYREPVEYRRDPTGHQRGLANDKGDLAVRVFDDQLRCRFCFDRSEAGFKSSHI
ncbi:unnamed protein product [Bursaphelenchus okinawaensis]|uniref:LIM zinc-binding domain-containing protein n=1 Tax=Bursaphelenchus okinawaensis TaxID=465554 RepID=A0A811KKA6_9BILA|nr:unnamed protein product [Bursaphelenchus okinawaensis]CAG9105017.1 unnamed protein product [Bursaphelenchus okinawaensis]